MGKGTVRSRRVEAMRQRKAELDDARVRAEHRVDGALVSYAAAAEALEELKAKADTQRTAQAEALQTMRDNGRALDEIATMVELPATEVRRATRGDGNAERVERGADNGAASETPAWTHSHPSASVGAGLATS